MSNGAVMCWGDGGNGQLGDGTGLSSFAPVRVSGIHDATAITSGSDHTCALRDNGTVRCWGKFGNSDKFLTPFEVDGISTAVAIDSGGGRACAVLADGSAKCWGSMGRITSTGGGLQQYVYPPVEVPGLTDAETIDSHSIFDVCASLSDGTVQCWDQGTDGRWFDGPNPIGGVNDATAVSLGGGFACATLTGGAGACWGSNDRGQLGNSDPSVTSSTTPLGISGFETIVPISSERSTSCGVAPGGQVMCWGYNGDGTLGNPVDEFAWWAPIAALGVSSAIDVDVGPSHACAVRSDSTVMCWGRNQYGQLGDGSNTDSVIPVIVHDL